MDVLLAIFGRLHPALLHLPIGLLAGLALLEAVAIARGRAPAPMLLAGFAALAALLAAGSGWLLHEEPDYEGGGALVWHERLGIGVAACALITALLRARGATGAYRAALFATAALLVPAGHFGATLTHGAGFLLEPLREDEGPAAPRAEPAPPQPGLVLASYAEHVAPFLEARCTSCHGERKKKGGLRLDAPEAILKGGKGGDALVAGDADGSELLARMLLPPDDEDRMPPEHKAQPTAAEIALVRAWIAAGASFDAPFALGEGAELPPPPPAAEAEAELRPAPARALAALQEQLVHVQPVAQGSQELWVDFAAPAAAIRDEDARRLLDPLTDHVAELSLARTRIGDRTLELVAEMDRLRRLDLRGTAVGDDGLARLRGHAALEELVLSRTRLTDASVEVLLELPALARVWVWECGLTAEALARLRAERPRLAVEEGGGASAPLETEGELVFSGDAPPVDAPPPAPAGLVPINATCPVSGKPVDPRYAVVFEGRVIGFCCPDCPKDFWADPERFRAALGN
jgi:uncharacterized membrane protein